MKEAHKRVYHEKSAADWEDSSPMMMIEMEGKSR